MSAGHGGSAVSADTAVMHPVEVDLLCALADVEAPFPLDVPSVGTTDGQRRLMFRAGREQLTRRGLADEHGPAGVAQRFVRLLRTATGTLDLVLANGSATLGAVALVDGDDAVLAVQRPDQAGQVIAMRAMTLDQVVGELQTMVPFAPAAPLVAFTLPMRPVRRLFDAITIRPTPLPVSELDELTRVSGIDPPLAQRLTNTLRVITGSGQTGVTRRDHVGDDWRRTATEVRWVDTPRGRVRLGGDADSAWLSVNPFGANDIRTTLRELAAHVRG